MPRYDYRCPECSYEVEIQRSFNDDKEILCFSCAIPLIKVFSSTPIHFKGSGFYSTDSK